MNSKNKSQTQMPSLNRLPKSLAIVLLFMVISTCLPLTESIRRPDPDYSFSDGVISRKVLESYLSRSITQANFLSKTGFTEGDYNFAEDDIRMLKNIGVKFVGRSLFFWCEEQYLLETDWLENAKMKINLMHQYDPDIIFQAAIFESISTKMDQVPVPSWVFEDWNLPVISRNFSYNNMLNEKGAHVNHWAENRSVPDISRLETQHYFYYLARIYMDIGIEAIHFGQVELMAMEEAEWQANFPSWFSLLEKIRGEALVHARRGTVLCDAHTPSGGFLKDGKLLFDFHSFPLRIEEVPGEPMKGQLKVGYLDSLYRRSKGGITPSGWICDSLPYLVEFDNWGNSPTPGQNVGECWIWGYDEISWFAQLNDSDAKAFVRYAYDWLAKVDPNGFLEMPGNRRIDPWIEGGSYYRANTVSDSCPTGRNLEEFIKYLWNENDDSYFDVFVSINS